MRDSYFYNLPLIKYLHDLGIIRTPEEKLEAEKRFDNAVTSIDNRVIDIEYRNNILSIEPKSKRIKQRLSFNYNLDNAILGAIKNIKLRLYELRNDIKKEKKSIKEMEKKPPLDDIVKVRKIRKKFMQRLEWWMSYLDKKKERIAEQTVRMKADLADIYSDKIEEAMDGFDKFAQDYSPAEIAELKKSKNDEFLAEKSSDEKELNITKQARFAILEKKRSEIRKKYDEREKKALSKYNLDELKNKEHLAKNEVEQWRAGNKRIGEMRVKQDDMLNQIYTLDIQHEYLAFRRKEYYVVLLKSKLYELFGIKEKPEELVLPTFLNPQVVQKIAVPEMQSHQKPVPSVGMKKAEGVKKDDDKIRRMYHVNVKPISQKPAVLSREKVKARKQKSIDRDEKPKEKEEQVKDTKGSSNLKSCILLVNKCEGAFKGGDINQAQMMYVKAVNSYLKLSEEEKNQIHKRLESLYDDINRAKKKKK